MNLGQIRSRVRSVVRDTAGVFITDPEITEWANEALLDLVARLRLLQDQAAGVTAGNTIALPADLLEVSGLRLGAAGDDVAFVDTDTWFDYSDAGGTPPVTLGRVFGGTLELYPTPTTGTAYSLRYVVKPAVLTADSDTPEIPEELHVRLANYARAHAKYKAAELNEGNTYMALYEANLPSSPRGRRRQFPGSLSLTPIGNTFDDDPEARHN
jgi:hypothetical protein